EHDHGQADIGAILGNDALDERALLALRPRRGIAANLPVLVHGAHRALGGGLLTGGHPQACSKRRKQRDLAAPVLAKNAVHLETLAPRESPKCPRQFTRPALGHGASGLSSKAGKRTLWRH